MQQQPPPQPYMLAPPPPQVLPPTAGITTDVIQKLLDENKQLIRAILDNQNLGKLAECAEYQAKLQKNLLYLAAIADAQPQISSVRPQGLPEMAMQQGIHYMQPPPQGLPLRPSPPFNPQQMPQQLPPHLLYPHQGPVQQMGMRPAVNNDMHDMGTETTFGGANTSIPSSQGLSALSRGGVQSRSMDARGSAQDTAGVSVSENAARGRNMNASYATSEQRSDREPQFRKNPDDPKSS